MNARSGQQFQNLLLKSTSAAFEARKAMIKALEQVHKIWFQFSNGKEIDTSMLQEYAKCCGRRNTRDTLHYRTELDAHIRCAYCTALQTLRDYRRILNQETAKNSKNFNANGGEDWVEDIAYGDQVATVETNPLNCALSVVATQVGKLRDTEPWVKTMAHSLTNLLMLLSNELSFLGKIMSHTQEWWDAYHDTQQFAIRLQSSRPDETAFISLEEVETRLEQSSRNEPGNRKALEDHLKKLQFIRSQHKEHIKESTIMCPVCMEYLSPTLRRFFIIIAGCWHCLCEPCFDETRRTSSVCPVCRNSIDRTLSNKNDYLIHWGGVNIKEDNQDQDLSDEIHIIGDHSSKVNEVLRCLLRLKSEDPAAKVVVFSSWTSILVTIEEALKDNGISCSHFLQPHDQGLQEFRSPNTEFWVLLIPLSLGANGLNITEANHVILVDPILNPGKERQAIARLHRIGQTR
nr:snf2 histone linker phd ring helicase [Hymenolepis microstoma]